MPKQSAQIPSDKDEENRLTYFTHHMFQHPFFQTKDKTFKIKSW